MHGGTGLERCQFNKKLVNRFNESNELVPFKGINLLGTGDVQFEPWMEFLKTNLSEVDYGIFEYGMNSNSITFQSPKYLLQTELIFTGPVLDTGKKKRVHVIILFPSFDKVMELNILLDSWGVSRQNMARPFIVCDTTEEVNQRVNAIFDLDPLVEVIPAHVLTPEGVYGGNLRINYLDDFFGDSAQRIQAIETGLSADPSILALIPELDNLSLISNADAHSSKLNRVGREFTSFKINKFDYKSIIDAIRRGRIDKTAEFHPTEGRYFLSGHRGDRTKPAIHKKNQFCYFSPKNQPLNDICPQCNKELTIGVLQRAFEISEIQGGNRSLGEGPKRPFITMVPLIEILSYSLKISTISSKRLLRKYNEIINIVGTEANLWISDTITEKLIESRIEENIISDILLVKNGNFCFKPSGYDGTYGELKIGETSDFSDIAMIHET